ncbi:3840_t:CDS:2 [Entrophospora sp. SA101]|nr:3840_t:CDS:2 [Entrophospora sp. SA101]
MDGVIQPQHDEKLLSPSSLLSTINTDKIQVIKSSLSKNIQIFESSSSNNIENFKQPNL